MTRARSALALALFVAITFTIGGLGALATASNVTGWYANAAKALWSPPNALFGPVWSLLYLLIAISGWLVWRERHRVDVRPALVAFVVQLALNAVWTPVFFALYPAIGIGALWLALAIIVAIDVAVLQTMLRFWKVSQLAAWLLVPYWVWVLFATTLNLAIALLN